MDHAPRVSVRNRLADRLEDREPIRRAGQKVEADGVDDHAGRGVGLDPASLVGKMLLTRGYIDGTRRPTIAIRSDTTD